MLNNLPKSATSSLHSSGLRSSRSKIGGADSGVVPRLPGATCRAVQSSSSKYSAEDIAKKPLSLQRARLPLAARAPGRESSSTGESQASGRDPAVSAPAVSAPALGDPALDGPASGGPAAVVCAVNDSVASAAEPTAAL